MLRRACLLLTLAISATLALRAAEAIEGHWRITSSGVEFSITRSGADIYDIHLLDSPDMSLMPGTLIGTLERTPLPGRFVARMTVDPSSPDKRRRQLLFKLTPEGSISFEPINSGRRISLWRWIPYLFRVTVVENRQPPADIHGAVRTDVPDLTRHRVL